MDCNNNKIRILNEKQSTKTYRADPGLNVAFSTLLPAFEKKNAVVRKTACEETEMVLNARII